MAAKENVSKRKSATSKSAKPKLKKPAKATSKSKPKKSASKKPSTKIAKTKAAKRKTAKKKTVTARRATPARAVSAKSVAKKAPAAKSAARKTTRTDSRLVDLDAGLEPNIRRARSGGQSGDLQGLSDSEGANSESVDELLEEGNSLEAAAVAGVEEADDEDEREVHTHEVPEYLEKDE